MNFAKILFIFVLLGLLSGCATYKRSMPFPESSGNIKLDVLDDMPSKWNQPVGAHINKETRLILTGHQGSNAGIFFGVLGVLAQDAIQTSSGKEQFGSAMSNYKIDWIELSKNIIQDLIQSYPMAQVSLNDGSQVLELTPYGIFDVANQSDAKLFLVLQVTLKDRNSKTLWETRYFLQTTKSYPLAKNSGWGEAGVYENELREGLKTLYTVLFKQISNQYKEGSELLVNFTLPYLWISEPLKAHKLGEEENYVILRLKLADAILSSGYHIVLKDDIKYQ